VGCDGGAAVSDAAERLLAHIARADSRRPARAADVAAALGGPEPEFWAALETLQATRQVNSALIHRPATDPEPWLAIWPTGVLVDNGAWRNGSHVPLFVPQRPLAPALAEAAGPRAARVAQAPRKPSHQENRMNPEEPKATGRDFAQQRVLAVLTAAAAPMTCTDLAVELGTPVENVYSACTNLLRKGLIERLGDKRKTYQLAGRAAPAEPATPTPAPAPVLDETPIPPGDLDAWEPEPAEESASHDGYRYDPAAEDGPAPRFALWDDGALDIVEADRVLRLGREDVRRLAMLLGVPGAQP